jgi:hypothetical protein
VISFGYCSSLLRAAYGQAATSTTVENRILRIIQAYGKQGFHRTGTATDNSSGRWLRDQVRRTGVAASLESFSLERIDPVLSSLTAGERQIEGMPLFDGGFTDEKGIRDHLA